MKKVAARGGGFLLCMNQHEKDENDHLHARIMMHMIDSLTPSILKLLMLLTCRYV